MSIVQTVGLFQFTIALGLLIGMTVVLILAIHRRSIPEWGRKLTFLVFILSLLAYVLGTFFFHGGVGGYHRMMSGAGPDPEHFDLSHAAFHSSRMLYSIVSALGLVMTMVAALLQKSPGSKN